ncbi:hypothetical protein PVAR5_5290 [Paecilomyces variotii No. 5]|uniref:Uncharacterized protein n=1 Tax=Byssochlamys spectabilis (strain No. 5 / NBRC 109023) TaxID=1356009 RepID=V5FG60_BYSSN|nr:hypothetical protein PVAR5_5290 [Paecilomyces variotii No. 5]
MIAAKYLALLWVILALAIPSQSASTGPAYPALSHFLVANLCGSMHKGTGAQNAVCHYLGSESLDTGDDDSAITIENGRDVPRPTETAVSSERPGSSKRPVYGRMIYKRSDDHPTNDADDDTEGDKQNNPTGAAKTTTEASKPTETTALQTTSKSEESNTKTKDESTAIATASTSSDDTTWSSTSAMSKTQVSTTSGTKAASVTQSGTSVVTATSKASTTTSNPSRTHTATIQAQQTGDHQFNEATYHKASIAAGVVLGFFAFVAIGVLLVMYIRKRIVTRKRLQDISGDSGLPLVESGGHSRSASAQGHRSGTFDRESLMWAPTQSSMSFIPVAVEPQKSRHEPSPMLATHSTNYAPASGTTSHSRGSSSSSAGSESRILTSPVPSVVVVPPSPSLITEIPAIRPIPPAATGSGSIETERPAYERSIQTDH